MRDSYGTIARVGDDSAELRFFPNKAKVALFVVGIVAISGGAIAAALLDDQFNRSLLLQLLIFALVAVMDSVLLDALPQFVATAPQVIVDADGIVARFPLFGVQRLAWGDIVRLAPAGASTALGLGITVTPEVAARFRDAAGGVRKLRRPLLQPYLRRYNQLLVPNLYLPFGGERVAERIGRQFARELGLRRGEPWV